MKTKQVELKEQAYASNLKSRALSVLIYLIDRSNQELTCFPAISTMAEQLHISVSTVKRALRELVDEGYICKDARFREKNRRQSSNLYTLRVQEGQGGMENSDGLDDNGDLEPVMDNSSVIGAERKQEQDTSAAMPKGKGGEYKHIGFGNLKKQEERKAGERGKEKGTKATLGDRRERKEEIVPMECPSKEFDKMPKQFDAILEQKRSFYIHRHFVDCILVCFGSKRLKACFRKMCILCSEQVGRKIKVCLSDAYLLLSWMGEGVSLNPP